MKTPTYMYRFASSSGSGTYETLKYNDGSLSCDCMGWTRRVAPDGSRTCKHVRAVEAGLGQIDASTHGPVGAGVKAAAAKPFVQATPKLKQSAFSRKFV